MESKSSIRSYLLILFLFLFILLTSPQKANSEESDNNNSVTSSNEVNLSSHYYTQNLITLEGKILKSLTVNIGKVITSRAEFDSIFEKNKFSVKYKLPSENNVVIDPESKAFQDALSKPGVYPITITENSKEILKTYISVAPKDFASNLQTIFLVEGKKELTSKIDATKFIAITREDYSKESKNSVTNFDNSVTLGDVTHETNIMNYIKTNPSVNNYATCPSGNISPIALIESKNLSARSNKFSSQKIQSFGNSTVFPTDEKLTSHLNKSQSYELKASYFVSALNIAALEEPSKVKTLNATQTITNIEDLNFINKLSDELNLSPTNFINGESVKNFYPKNIEIKPTTTKCTKTESTLISNEKFNKKINSIDSVREDIEVKKNKLVQLELNDLVDGESQSVNFADKVYSQISVILPKTLRSTGVMSKFPVTITNKSKYNVKNKLTFVGVNTEANPKEINVDLDSNKTKSVEFEVTSKSGGTHKVNVVLGSENNLYTKEYSTTIRSQGFRSTGIFAMICFVMLLLLWWGLYNRKNWHAK